MSIKNIFQSKIGKITGTTCGLTSISGRDKILKRMVETISFDSVLDVGCGVGDLYFYLDSEGVSCDGTGVDLVDADKLQFDKFNYVKQEFLRFNTEEKYDLVFSSHVIEHVPDTGLFLMKYFSMIAPGGSFCMIWPPPKRYVVGGHVHTFNMGLMVYNIIRCGVDCSSIQMYRSGYNLAVMGQYKPIGLPALTFNRYEIDALAPYFPVPVKHSFDGDLKKYVTKL